MSAPRQLCTFRLDGLWFGLAVSRVQEVLRYQPLTPVDHAMPAYTLANSYSGAGLGTSWSSPYKRSAFVASFHYSE